MKSYRLERFGSLDGLVSVREDVPRPAAGEVLVRVKATSLNFRDLAILMGWSPFPAQPGRIPLSDAAGEVEAVGGGVTRFKAGDRVVASFYPTWFGGARLATFDFYGTERDGWLTEYKVVSAESLSLAPPHLTFEEAATLPCAGVTAWSALAGVGPGDTVLTQGTGGVSLFALQLAKVPRGEIGVPWRPIPWRFVNPCTASGPGDGIASKPLTDGVQPTVKTVSAATRDNEHLVLTVAGILCCRPSREASSSTPACPAPKRRPRIRHPPIVLRRRKSESAPNSTKAPVRFLMVGRDSVRM